MSSSNESLTMGPLSLILEVVVFVALRGMAFSAQCPWRNRLHGYRMELLGNWPVACSMVTPQSAVRISQVGKRIQWKGTHRRIKLLLANVVIICVDICTVTIKFVTLWGMWCSFKGFRYSVKLKVDFAILNQLRELVKGPNEQSYDLRSFSKNNGFSFRQLSQLTTKKENRNRYQS
ncbi:hypothetical protein DDE83_001973 [Stemphylium lycopersici]|uniref:Uncharacterized protein n=1 Tax=Stemphylium lycopersici TaxID=183478 RepID=A0A364NB54_STELY|nr:hypothetical protein DDE83_001973 [Stemphylium lycopersici]